MTKPKTAAAADDGDQRQLSVPEASERALAAPVEHEQVSPAMAPSWLTPQSMEAALHLCEVMAKAKLVPEHLRGSPGDCLLVVSQAARWGIDPFAVAQATAIVRGKLCYEGKLVATVLRATGAISGRLDYQFEGAGQQMSVLITGTPRGGSPKQLRGTVAQWRTENGNWDKDPQSMLVYRGTRQWARLFAPEAMLGVLTPDEAEDIKEAVVVGGSPGVHVTAPPAPPPAPPVAPPPSVDAQITAEYATLQRLAGKPVASLFWNHWKKTEQKADRLDAIRRANVAMTTITDRLGAKAESLLGEILIDRQNREDVVGILADLEKAAGAAPASTASDDQPPY